MAKRVRGSTSRPGQRAPRQKSAARPSTRPVAPTASAAPTAAAAPRSESLTDAEEARAAVLEAAIVAQEREHEATSKSKRAARNADPLAARPGSSLAISAADEYQYVARDVRRIAIVGGTLIAILIGLWIVITATGFKLF